jgi:hypothetical protein
LVETQFPIFKYTKMPFAFTNSENKFRFRVRAKNGCGWGEASEPLEVVKSTVPGEIPYFNVNSRGCGLNIQWHGPENEGGKPIKRFRIDFQSENEQFFQFDEFGCGNDPYSNECNV